VDIRRYLKNMWVPT